jgi:hypothetical protein
MLGVPLADDMAGPTRYDIAWARHSVAAEACVPRSTRAPQVWRGQRGEGVDAGADTGRRTGQSDSRVGVVSRAGAAAWPKQEGAVGRGREAARAGSAEVEGGCRIKGVWPVLAAHWGCRPENARRGAALRLRVQGWLSAALRSPVAQPYTRGR